MKNSWKTLFDMPIEIVKFIDVKMPILNVPLQEIEPIKEIKITDSLSFMNAVNNHLATLNLKTNEDIDENMADKYIKATFSVNEAIADILMVYHRVNDKD